MIAAGLVISGEDVPVSFDRFRDRVIFPIADFRGAIVGFGGRALASDVPAKYLNSPETELFHKGSLLYNGAEARKAVHDAGTVIAVEGYVDVVRMVSAGFAHTVAPLGTALTERQLQILWRMADEPILCFDGDKAGIRAASRAPSPLPFLQPGKSLRFALLPEARTPTTDPQSGREAMAECLPRRPLVDLLGTADENGVFDARAPRRARSPAPRGGPRDRRRERAPHYGRLQRARRRFFRSPSRPGASGGGNAGRTAAFSTASRAPGAAIRLRPPGAGG
jgi:DNA primase